MLGGCTLAPEYTRPEAPVPADWPTGAAYEETEAAPGAPTAAELPWREFFTDERLQKVIETALNNNRDLRLAALNVERARAIVRHSAGRALADGQCGRQREQDSGCRPIFRAPGARRPLEQYDVNLGITSWEIDFFGRIRSLKDRALEEYLATEQARRSAQILLVSAVANAYLALAADRENLKLAETTLETQEAAYDLIQTAL